MSPHLLETFSSDLVPLRVYCTLDELILHANYNEKVRKREKEPEEI